MKEKWDSCNYKKKKWEKIFRSSSYREKKRKVSDKQNYEEQADMWKRDAEDFFKMEDERKRREKEINLMHVEMLKQQMNEKKG